MKCNQILDLFEDAYHGTISEDNKQILAKHLAECQICQKKYEIYTAYMNDAKEEVFEMPPQLAAQLQYNLSQQLKQKKKVPFWQKKQFISYATACSLLFVVALWGGAHYNNLKQDITPVLTDDVQSELVDTKDIQPDPQPQTMGTEVSSQTKTTPKTKMSNTQTEPSDTTNEVVSFNGENTEGSGSEIAADEAQTYSRMAPSDVATADSAQGADITLDASLRNSILEKYEHQELATDLYHVCITTSQLEEIVGFDMMSDSEKTEFIIRFATAAN